MSFTTSRTVSFYEVVQSKAGGQKRLPQVNWQKALDELAKRAESDREWTGANTYVGYSYASAAQNHLVLHRVKDTGEWLHRRSKGQAGWSDAMGGTDEYLETSALSFLGFGNVVGLVKGSQSAPTHKGFEQWLNGVKLLNAKDLVVRPVLGSQDVAALNSADGVQRAEFKVGTSQKAGLLAGDGSLNHLMQEIHQELGAVNVSLVISVPQGKGRDDKAGKLLGMLKNAGSSLTGNKKAEARLLKGGAGAEYAELVEFVEHHITKSAQISSHDKDGNVVRIASAVTAIQQLGVDMEPILRDATGT